MTRRALFAALASLPFVGRFVKKPAPVIEWTADSATFVLDCSGPAAATWAIVTDPPLEDVKFRTASGHRERISFAMDPETGRWYEYDRSRL